MKKKLILLASLGSGLEYYDFMLFAIFAPFIARAFFPNDDKVAALISAYGIFAISYLLRPIGGVLFGMFGDRFGRKKTFVASVSLMAISTLGMACVPSYHVWGLTATVAFTALRMLQGIAFGAELPGALTFLIEHLGRVKYRGFSCALMIMSISIGACLGSSMGYLMPKLTSATQMAAWGWRMPFVFGGISAIVAYFLRRKTQETPYFKAIKKPLSNPLWVLISQHPKTLFFGCGLMLLPAAWVMFGLTIPTLLPALLHAPATNIYLYNTLGFLWCTLLIPLSGYVSDRVGRKKLFLIALTMSFIFPLLFSLLARSANPLLGFILLYQTIGGIMAGCYFTLLTEYFPVNVRYTGVAFCYNVIYAFAAFIPALTELIYHHSGHAQGIIGLFIGLACITFVITWLATTQFERDLIEVTT